MRTMRTMRLTKGVFFVSIVALSAWGCGPSAPSPNVGGETPDERPNKPSGALPTFESEIGALDESKVTAVFERSASKLQSCYNKSLERIPFLSGEVQFQVRVAKDGSARWVVLKGSTLGDHETESCMVSVLKGAKWPEPVGGEGVAENGFTFQPSEDERMPVDWQPDQLGAPFAKIQPELTRCRADANTGALKATMYIDTEGKPSAVGVSASDEHGEAAIRCVVELLRQTIFPSPGSYASKVTVTID